MEKGRVAPALEFLATRLEFLRGKEKDEDLNIFVGWEKEKETLYVNYDRYSIRLCAEKSTIWDSLRSRSHPVSEHENNYARLIAAAASWIPEQESAVLKHFASLEPLSLPEAELVPQTPFMTKRDVANH